MVPSGMKTFNAIGWKNPDWIIKKKYVPNMIKYRFFYWKIKKSNVRNGIYRMFDNTLRIKKIQLQ